MRSLRHNAELQAIAKRIIWFEESEQAIVDPIRFMAYALTYASYEDMQTIRRHVTDEEIREALAAAPAGIIDPRSWAYWHLKVGIYPPPPMTRRKF